VHPTHVSAWRAHLKLQRPLQEKNPRGIETSPPQCVAARAAAMEEGYCWRRQTPLLPEDVAAPAAASSGDGETTESGFADCWAEVVFLRANEKRLAEENSHLKARCERLSVELMEGKTYAVRVRRLCADALVHHERTVRERWSGHGGGWGRCDTGTRVLRV